MKRSDLKKYIREEIINTLSEATEEEVQNAKELNKELEKTIKLQKQLGEDEDKDDEDAIRGAKKAKGKTKRYDLAVAGFKKIDREMRSLAKDYSKAEGAAKENLLAKLKELTKKKKEAKELVDKYADDVV